MRKTGKKLLALLLSSAMLLTAVGCGSNANTTTEETTEETTTDAANETTEVANETTDSSGKTKIKITWWGGQSRHEYTQQLLDLYTETHPDIEFEAVPAGWDGYFEKLSTQTASGSMPDIVQMDYLYISTYAKNNSLADLNEFIENGTIDVSGIDENLLNTGSIDGKMSGLVLATSLLSVGYNPAVLAEAGVEMPDSSWTWSDFVELNKKIKDTTGKYGASMGPVEDTNIFNYWVRQHGASLFSEDNKSLGYEDDSICADFFTMWKSMMDEGSLPNPDEWAQIASLGQEAGPVVTNDAGMIFEWNNYASKVSGVNDKIKITTPPLSDDSSDMGLWLKPGMFFSVAETSTVKQEAAEFINWFINSEEANDIILGERGTPVSSKIREYLSNSGKLSEQQVEMFEYADTAAKLCGVTPAPDPVGMSEVTDAFKEVANAVFYEQMTADEGAAKFREKANEILSRNN